MFSPHVASLNLDVPSWDHDDNWPNWRGQKPPRWEDKPCTNNPSLPERRREREREREREFPECSFTSGFQTGWNEVSVGDRVSKTLWCRDMGQVGQQRPVGSGRLSRLLPCYRPISHGIFRWTYDAWESDGFWPDFSKHFYHLLSRNICDCWILRK